MNNMRVLKLYVISIFCLLFSINTKAQSFGIGTDTPDPQSILELASTTRGMLAPRMTTAQRNLIPVVAGQDFGLLIYNLTTAQFNYWDGTQWVAMLDIANNNYWTRAGSNLYPTVITNDVGIGTATPVSRLEVAGGRLEVTTNTTASGLTGTGSIEIANSLRLSALDIASNNNSILYMQYSNNADLDVDNGTLRVDASTNNVGIGIAAPLHKLDIFHNSSVADAHIRLLESGNDYARLNFSNDNFPTAYWSIAGYANTTSATALLNFYFNNGSTGLNWMSINGVGHVVLNATTDASGLAGSGVLQIGGGLRMDGNEIITNTNTPLYLQNDNGGDLYVDNGTFMVDASTDRVGIGVFAPAAKLQVTQANNATGIYSLSTLNGIAVYGYNTGTGEGGRFVGANMDPGGGWWFCFGTGATACGGNESNFAGAAGTYAGGVGVGSAGVARMDAVTTTDHTGGLFITSTSTGSNVRAMSAVGADINGTVFKIAGFGTVSTLVQDLEGKIRIMHAPETPEALFQDYGKGKLNNGEAYIKLDPIFSKNIIVDDKHPLRVFIQLRGDCKGTYVTAESEKGFKVKELMGGRSNTEFYWTVTANRKDEMIGGQISKYQDLRFEPMRDAMHKYEHHLNLPSTVADEIKPTKAD
jgi:hypothetical protein